MKFLLDMPVSPRIVEWLNGRGHDAIHASAIGLDRAADREVLVWAAREGRIIVTADTDFPHLLVLSQESTPGIILFRGGHYTQEEMERLLARVLDAISADTLARAICTVDHQRIRCRTLPLK